MTRHSTNDTELFRKMTSLILTDKISPHGHSHICIDMNYKLGKRHFAELSVTSVKLLFEC